MIDSIGGLNLVVNRRVVRRLISRLSIASVILVGGFFLPPRKALAEEHAGVISAASIPYHPIVYHLDLAILTYQLHAQSLVWPFDPFFEESNNLKWDRKELIGKVRQWAMTKGVEQADGSAGLTAYRGPGILNAFPDNPVHDPIIYRYDRIDPSRRTIINAGKKWNEYMAPDSIAGKIRNVYVCYQPVGKAAGSTTIDQVTPGSDRKSNGGRDVLIAFEGGTGDKGEKDGPPSQSLMGFVLLRYYMDGSENYDIHIAFRGSCCGSPARAAVQSLSDEKANGNPDWITDLGYDLIEQSAGAEISTRGLVSRGFATSMISINPQVFRSLEKVAELTAGIDPSRIFVTGHSLGGALAQHFVSAVLLGDQYGPSGSGESMPIRMREWPWRNLKMITFSAPRAGNEEWARTLTTTNLESEFFSTTLDPVDRAALEVTDTEILSRLLNPQRPVGYRVLNSRDPVTTEKLLGGKHTGKTVYVNRPKMLDLVSAPDLNAHDLLLIRDDMLQSLHDSQIPLNSTRHLDMKDLNPDRKPGKSGSLEEFEKLKGAIDRYYSERGVPFDHNAFHEDFETYMTILKPK